MMNATLGEAVGDMTTIANVSTVLSGDENEIRIAQALSHTGTALGIAAVIMNIAFLVGARGSRDTATPYFTILQNLSVADMLASLTFLITQNWPSGPFAFIEPSKDLLLVLVLPYVFRSTPWMFMTVYFLSLTFLAVTHYFAVCKPWRYSELVERNTTKRLLVLIWSLASLQIVVPLTVLLALCMQKNRKEAMSTLFVVSRLEAQIWMALFAVSTLANVWLNVMIYRKIKFLRKKRKQMKMSFLSQETRIIQRKQRAFVTVSLLIINSILFRLPLPLMGIIGFMIRDLLTNYLINGIVVLLLYVNFVGDPVIYLIRISEVHSWYKSFFAARCKSCCWSKTAVGCLCRRDRKNKYDPQPLSATGEVTQQFSLLGKSYNEDGVYSAPQEVDDLRESRV